MQAILDADYSFTPAEYWSGVSETARDFIAKCLTVNPLQRMTAHQALNHAWVLTAGDSNAGGDEKAGSDQQKDLLPNVKKNFNARVKLHAAIDTVRAINQLRAGQHARMMAAKAGGKMDFMQTVAGAKAHSAAQQAPAGAEEAAEVKKAQELARPGPEDQMEGIEGTGELGSKDYEADKMDVDSGYGTASTKTTAS
jgi:hypothetical protein